MIPKGWIGLTHAESGKHVYVKAVTIDVVVDYKVYSEISSMGDGYCIPVRETPQVIFDLITDVQN